MSNILFENQGGVLAVTFNRVDKDNGLNGAMAKALAERFKVVTEDRAIRAVIISGAGPHFMKGEDMTMHAGAQTAALQDLVFQKTHALYSAIREIQNMEKPVIAAVQGYVTGAGFSIMLACDIVIAAQGTVFNAGFTSNAFVPDAGTTFLLPRKVGMGRAAEILMLNEDFAAAQAHEWGLVNRIVADDALQAEGMALAQKLGQGATRILGATKKLIGKSFNLDMQTHMSNEAAAATAGSKTFDYREAIKAIGANIPPKYTGS